MGTLSRAADHTSAKETTPPPLVSSAGGLGGEAEGPGDTESMNKRSQVSILMENCIERLQLRHKNL